VPHGTQEVVGALGSLSFVPFLVDTARHAHAHSSSQIVRSARSAAGAPIPTTTTTESCVCEREVFMSKKAHKQVGSLARAPYWPVRGLRREDVAIDTNPPLRVAANLYREVMCRGARRRRWTKTTAPVVERTYRAKKLRRA
jgi:hypothetical protein